MTVQIRSPAVNFQPVSNKQGAKRIHTTLDLPEHEAVLMQTNQSPIIRANQPQPLTARNCEAATIADLSEPAFAPQLNRVDMRKAAIFEPVSNDQSGIYHRGKRYISATSINPDMAIGGAQELPQRAFRFFRVPSVTDGPRQSRCTLPRDFSPTARIFAPDLWGYGAD